MHGDCSLEGGERLLNTYAVVVDPDGRRARDAQEFADWMADGGGRGLIADYRVGGGLAAFHVWPTGRSRAGPRDLPF